MPGWPQVYLCLSSTHEVVGLLVAEQLAQHAAVTPMALPAGRSASAAAAMAASASQHRPSSGSLQLTALPVQSAAATTGSTQHARDARSNGSEPAAAAGSLQPGGAAHAASSSMTPAPSHVRVSSIAAADGPGRGGSVGDNDGGGAASSKRRRTDVGAPAAGGDEDPAAGRVRSSSSSASQALLGGAQPASSGGAGSSGLPITTISARAAGAGAQRHTAVCGVHMVWVAPSHRRKGLASRMLTACRSHMLGGYVVPLAQVAFSAQQVAAAQDDAARWAARYVQPAPVLLYGD